ncbi:MAG TPA: potassium channel protein [Pyrinomonadaceae bacterium]|nr:potassium channel protein [Pyrinomonadaceae bacterium]
MPFLAKLSRRSRARLVYPALALTAAVLFGALGFSVIEGWSLVDSLYMSVMTVTTVGYGPPQPLSSAGVAFSVFFMVVGVTTAGYALSSTVQAFVQSEIIAALDKRRRHREMSRLHNHFIICGAGRVGSRVIRELRRAGREFVVVERNPDKVSELTEEGVHALARDATLDDTLREAGIERARGLAACLPDDADNLYLVLTARDLNRGLYIVARAVQEEAEPKLIKAGASRVVAPIIISSHRMAQALIKPAVADFMDSVAAESLDLGFEQVEVAHDSVYVNKRLRFTNIRSELDIVIVAIRRRTGEMVFNPAGDARIEAGDLLIAIGRAENLAELSKLARTPRPEKE